MSEPQDPQPENAEPNAEAIENAEATSADAVENAVDDAAAAVSDAATSDAAANETVENAAPAVDYAAVDPDLAAFEEAEREHPGTFAPAVSFADKSDNGDKGEDAEESEVIAVPTAAPAEPVYDEDAPAWPAAPAPEFSATPVDAPEAVATEAVAEAEPSPFAPEAVADTLAAADAAAEAPTVVAPAVATTAYEPPAEVVAPVTPSEPAAAAVPLSQQPIFVQAPEAPRDRGNRGTAGLIGLLATIVFAILFLGTQLGLGALEGTVTAENIADAALKPLLTLGFWIPVVVFFLGFWLLGALINRGRWGHWVVFGLFVGIVSYGGYLLGQLFEAPFWSIAPSKASALLGEQMLAPLAIAAFIFGRELTIWFGAWVARSGARKTELNAEAQREYERIIEAGPTLPGA